MKVLEERLVYLFAVFCKDLLCSCFHFGSRTFICMFNIFVFPPPLTFFQSFGGIEIISRYFTLDCPLLTDIPSVAHLVFDWMTKSSSTFLPFFGPKSTTLLSVICHSLAIQQDIFLPRSIHIGMTSEHYDKQSGWFESSPGFGFVVLVLFAVLLVNFTQTSTDVC